MILSDINSEKSILGYVLINPKECQYVIDELSENDFADDLCSRIYAAMRKLKREGNGVNVLTVLEKTNIPQVLLESLINSVPVGFDMETQIKILRKYSLKRKINDLGNTSIRLLENSDPYEIVSYLEKAVGYIDNYGVKNYQPISDLVFDLPDELQNLQLQKSRCELFSGIAQLDYLINGFQGGQLVVIGGRPGMGKTTFALNMAYNQARKNECTAFFSLEMTAKQIRNKVVSCDSAIKYRKLKEGDLSADERERMIYSIDRVMKMPLLIGKSTDLDIRTVRSVARKLKKENNLRALYIDYLQLMVSGSDDSRVEEVTKISRALKLLALELDIPIFLLSQLNRDVENRKNRRPQLSDLRDSGSIEQDADMVIFLFLESYYKEKIADPDEKLSDRVEIIVAKNREGRVGSIQAGFYKPCCTFHDIG